MRGIKVSWLAPPVPHLFLIDDSVLFAMAHENAAKSLLKVLEDYEKASIPKMDLDNSSVAFSPNSPQSLVHQFQNILVVQPLSYHTKYLGFQESVSRNRRSKFVKS